VRVSRRARWLRALLVAPVLVFALGASSHLAVRCTMTGLLMPESCRPEVSDLGPTAPAHSSVEEAGCCEQMTVATARIPAAGSESLLAHPDASPISQTTPVALLVADPPMPPPAAAGRAAWRPGSSPPLYVATHAFLI
jgi:hypothetical protein